MRPKYIFFVVFMIVGLKSKSQTLLNLTLSEINKIIIVDKGVLVNNSSLKAKFSYTIPLEGNSCIFHTVCYFTSEHKCFKYINDYWGDELPNKEINRLKKYYPNLKKIDNKSQWVDSTQGFEITLMNEKDVKAAYLLKIERLNFKNKL